MRPHGIVMPAPALDDDLRLEAAELTPSAIVHQRLLLLTIITRLGAIICIVTKFP